MSMKFRVNFKLKSSQKKEIYELTEQCRKKAFTNYDLLTEIQEVNEDDMYYNNSNEVYIKILLECFLLISINSLYYKSKSKLDFHHILATIVQSLFCIFGLVDCLL